MHTCVYNVGFSVPAGHLEAHLRYPHCWVWLTASQLFGQLFAAHQPEQLVAVWKGEGGDDSSQPAATTFICNSLDKKVKAHFCCMLPLCCFLLINVLLSTFLIQMRELALTFCHQLQSKFLDAASGEQVTFSPKPDLKQNPSRFDPQLCSTGHQELAFCRQGDLPHFPRV